MMEGFRLSRVGFLVLPVVNLRHRKRAGLQTPSRPRELYGSLWGQSRHIGAWVSTTSSLGLSGRHFRSIISACDNFSIFVTWKGIGYICFWGLHFLDAFRTVSTFLPRISGCGLFFAKISLRTFTTMDDFFTTWRGNHYMAGITTWLASLHGWHHYMAGITIYTYMAGVGCGLFFIISVG